MLLLLTPPVAGLKVKGAPLQNAGTVSLATIGFGFTTTITVKLAPMQFPAAPDVGVTV